MHRIILVIAIALAFCATAQAAPPVEKGAPAKLSISPKRVDAGERFTLNARGFTPNAPVVVEFAITGEAPYSTYTPLYPTATDGTFSIPFTFAECRKTDTGFDVAVDLTITLTDSFGVHDSARLILC